MRNGNQSDFDATAGNVWIADALNYLRYTARHNPTAMATARIFQPYDYERQEFRHTPRLIAVRLHVDSLDRDTFYVFGQRVSYERFYRAITA